MFPKDGNPGGDSEGGHFQNPVDGGGGGLGEGVVRAEPSNRARGLYNPPPSPPIAEGLCQMGPPPRINITVAPFTGGPFEVRVCRQDSIDELKKVIARRLKVSKERIYLLYRESELVDGSLSTNLLVDGSTVTLLPRAETGLISPKPEQSVMQALESLNDQQVNDFLSGAAPLNLTMRLGDHMMLIQLQLSTVNQISSHRRKHSTIQISSSAPQFPTPPSSAPSSPTTLEPTIQPAKQPKKIRVPLLSPGGLQCPSTSSSSRVSSKSMPTAPAPQAALSKPSSDNNSSEEPPAKKPKLDPRALAEASKNLTHTLKQLSSEVLTFKPAEQPPPPKPKKEERHRKRRASSNNGAIIETMQHHGKGVYSGTFSGTLNPALQDASGQPKRDITTIIHILNDLLCAQFKAYSSGASSGSRSSRSSHRESTKIFNSNENKQTPFDCGHNMKNEDELLKTKVEALRRSMEEQKAKREARRQAARASSSSSTSSYSTAWSVKSSETSNTSSNHNQSGSSASSGCESGSETTTSSTDSTEHFISPEPEPVTA